MNSDLLVASANLHILPSTSTHHFPNCEPSLLDLGIVSSIEYVESHGQLSADGFSYHDLIFLSYKVRPPKTKSKVLWQRNFKNMNVELLQQDAADLNWDLVFDADTVDGKINAFNCLLIDLYDCHAPSRPVRLKHLPSPWLTSELRNLMAKKDAAKARYKFNSCDINKEKYKAARNRCNTACRDAQRRYIHAGVSNGDPTKVWKFLNTIGIGKVKQESPSDVDLNELNDHFTSGLPNFGSASKSQTLQRLADSIPFHHNHFSFIPVSESDVRKNITSISSNAVGCDEISRNMIIPILDVILPIITHILNFSLHSSTFPNTWKQAIVIPIPKISIPTSYSHFRPISILPFLSKVLERVVHYQLYNFLFKNNLMNALQSGFRPGHSTVTALVKVSDDIRLGMEQQKITLLTLLDFSNAFNTVDPDILLAILKSINISVSVVDWFRSYLNARRQRIKVDSKLSDWSDVKAGVPQGGVLSPLLFSIFINSITRNISCTHHLYADDLQIYTQDTVGNIDRAVDVMNRDLVEIASWASSHGLSVNPVKSQTIIIGSRGQLSRIDKARIPAVSFMGTVIPYCDIVKNLGVFVDSSLSWIRQVNEVSRKIFTSLKSLGRLRNFLPVRTKINLAQSLLLPILDYADVSYLDLNEDQLNKLERLQNAAIRFAFGLRKFDHVSEYRAQLKWLPIRLRRNSHILSLLFNILHSPTTPSYLKQQFRTRVDKHGRQPRACTQMLLECPTHKTEFYSQSFAVRAVRLWNGLPPSIRVANTLESFKNLLRSHYECECGYK